MKTKAFIISFLSFLFFLLGFYQLKFREAFLVKAGMSHFFSPGLVGILSYLLPVVSFAAAILVWFKGFIKAGAASGIILCIGYMLYPLLILLIGDASCDCANIFPDVGFKWQLVLFLVPLALSTYLFLSKDSMKDK
jgi:hypothetical protein